MIKELINSWNENKDKIEKDIRELAKKEYLDYEDLVNVVFSHLKHSRYGGDCEFNTKAITTIDDGDYQGTLIFIIPLKTYQPDEEDYFYTSVWYGSCCVCDILQGIMYDSNNEEQKFKDLRTLCMHIVQNTKYLVPKEASNESI